MAEGNLELIQGGYEAFGRGDIPAVLDIMADDVEWSVPEVLPHGGRYSGKQEVMGFFEKLGSIWEGFDLDIEDFVASGDRVCVIGRASGAVDGNQTGFGFVHAYTVRDGAVVKFDEYADPAPDLYR
jgi:ketosteroid isomerase-like protein